MSTSRKIDLVLVIAFAFALAACGDKVPESAAARKLGEQPKQIINKVTDDVNKALQKGLEQRQEAEKKE